ncbi:MAG TPA: hypothetical protein VKT50_11665 [Candidatus Acidoferrales bacterium]|nr:hypothetical protein [Candidatus Acidoferrales bacterium]
MTVFLAVLASLAILLAVFWLLFGSPAAEPSLSFDTREIEKVLPVNCRHFPQISQLLSQEDIQFMRERAPHHIQSKWRGERRRILKQYLSGLRQDFGRLERLARLIAAFSPEIRKRQEWEWVWLALQFHFSYRMVALKLAMGSFSPEGLAGLTEMIAGLTSELENRMALIAEHSPSRMRTDVGG